MPANTAGELLGPDGPHLIGGAYWMPQAFQSWFKPRGIFSFA